MEIKSAFNFKLKTFFLRNALAVIAISLSSLCYALSPAEFPVEFKATYTVETYGIVVAKATYTLEHTSNGLTFTQHSKPVGLASLFKKETLQETSSLSLHNNQLLLDSYSYTLKGSDKNRDINLNIDWIISDSKLQGRIHGTDRGNPVQLKASTPVWDTLSFQIPIMMHTNEKNPEWNTSLFVKNQLKNYSFITHDREKISVSGNNLNTIRVERRSDNKKPVFFWVAPGLFNLPVKIEKWKKGKPDITMQLETASFPSNKDARFTPIENLDDL